MLPFTRHAARPAPIPADPALDAGYEEFHFLDPHGHPLVVTCYTLDRWYRVPPSARPTIHAIGRSFVITITDGPPVEPEPVEL